MFLKKPLGGMIPSIVATDHEISSTDSSPGCAIRSRHLKSTRHELGTLDVYPLSSSNTCSSLAPCSLLHVLLPFSLISAWLIPIHGLQYHLLRKANSTSRPHQAGLSMLVHTPEAPVLTCCTVRADWCSLPPYPCAQHSAWHKQAAVGIY